MSVDQTIKSKIATLLSLQRTNPFTNHLIYNTLIKGINMQITKTEYNRELLVKWQNDILTEKAINEALSKHLQCFDEILHNVTRIKNFSVYVKGLLSNLSRKSMEPIALEYMGEQGVRSLQQFITRSNLDDERMLETYQNGLSETINSENGIQYVCFANTAPSSPPDFFRVRVVGGRQ